MGCRRPCCIISVCEESDPEWSQTSTSGEWERLELQHHSPEEVDERTMVAMNPCPPEVKIRRKRAVAVVTEEKASRPCWRLK